MEKLSLRIDNGEREIEVNDKGETIVLHLGDNNFVKKYYEIVEFVQSAEKDLGNYSSSDDKEKLEATCCFEKTLAEKVDNLIGEGTCMKVFNTNTPNSMLIAFFLDELLPFISDYADKRDKRFNNITSKYNPSRKGR